MTSDRSGATQTTSNPPDGLAQPTEPTVTLTNHLDNLIDSTGSLRSMGKQVSESAGARQQKALFIAWQRRTNERGKQAPKALLEEIGNLGFAWRDVARMMRVSVPAVQKWRRSGGVTGENRRRLASLLALCDEIAERYMIQEIASWFEMPISDQAPVTPIDLYAEGHADLVLEHAVGIDDTEQILTAYDTGWRERFRSDFEVYQDHDGQMSIRPKDA
ncbi:hypothetical protein [Streptomyces goshikiensis]|uniref:hypothetical protein n=1 Tax=Streptomyces goshikiensis TaxID=1942 RepID=UPI00331D8545